MQQSCFKILFRTNTFKIPGKFIHLNHISQDIFHCLVFNSDHKYDIKSDVSIEAVRSFINYLITDQPPDIQFININEYIKLSEEFQILQEMIEKKKNEFNGFSVNIRGLQNNDSSLYETEIAKKLDQYLETHGGELMKIPIHKLYNIFNHHERNLVNHNLAYELIIKEFQVSNNSNICLLLDSIDGTKLTRENIEDSIINEKDHFHHIPKNVISYFSQLIENQRKLEEKINELEDKIKMCEYISFTSPGLLNLLKKKENSPFDPLFIASLSTGDIYNLISPTIKDEFGLLEPKDFIEIELEKALIINGIILTSGSTIIIINIEIDGRKINIKKTDKPTIFGNCWTFNFDPIKCHKIKIINLGGDFFNRIELLSPDEKYSKGIFSTMIENIEKHDPHRCPVILSATQFDLNTFYLINTKKCICTLPEKNPWLQIEFTQGYVVLKGFRFKRGYNGKTKSFKIICTKNVNEPITQWTTLIEINEKKENEHSLLDVFRFEHISPPVKFVRLVQTGSDWSKMRTLRFFHFDLFGSYYS